MQETTKVSLSPFELDLVSDPGWVLTKNKIIEKVYVRFGTLSTAYQEILAPLQLPATVTSIAPKIARGEKYDGLPWVLLDYPRLFTPEHVFAIRSFFWWGHFFSVTLHLSGDHLQQYIEVLHHAFEKGKLQGAMLSSSEDPWQHHFREDNMMPANRLLLTKAKQCGFIKIGYKIPLKEWERAEDFLVEHYARLLGLLQP